MSLYSGGVLRFLSLVHLQWKPLRLLVRGLKLVGISQSICSRNVNHLEPVQHIFVMTTLMSTDKLFAVGVLQRSLIPSKQTLIDKIAETPQLCKAIFTFTERVGRRSGVLIFGQGDFGTKVPATPPGTYMQF